MYAEKRGKGMSKKQICPLFPAPFFRFFPSAFSSCAGKDRRPAQKRGGEGQRLVAPKNWIASESVNLFQVECDLINLVQEMNVQLAGHTHIPGPTPGSRTWLNFKSSKG